MSAFAEAVHLTRQIVVDTGCDWTQAGAKALEEVQLSDEELRELAARGLGAMARVMLNRPTHNRAIEDDVPRVEDLLKPHTELLEFVEYIKLSRVMRVNGMNKMVLDCDADDLSLLLRNLEKRRDGFNNSIAFVITVQAECAQRKCKVKGLPKTLLRQFEHDAPW